ncbi:aquaporin-like protein [Chytriomyces sp. MP71]|nr:aquaporin-like protein [Chytriomyces sp. MP71]
MFLFLFLSFGGVQSALATNAEQLVINPSLAFLQISLCFGFGLAIAIFFTYRISGGALNPAVNFGLMVSGIMDPFTFVAYTVAQVAGATLACTAVDFAFPGDFKGANQVFAGVRLEQAFVIESILTAGLVLTVLFLAVEKSKITFLAPLFIGIYVFVAHIISIPYTNTSINPARSFGAAMVTGVWENHDIFWSAPFAGAACAALIYKVFKIVGYEQLNAGQDSDGKVVVRRVSGEKVAKINKEE